MKNLILLFITSLMLTSCCKNETNPNEELPPATETGAGIFACKVNGQSFIDRSGDVAYHQLVSGDYYFGAGGNDKRYRPWSILLSTNKKQIFEGQTYILSERMDGNTTGGGGFPEQQVVSYTDSQYTGELKIIKLDYTNFIVSGTFWFDIKHPGTAATVQVRDGRFDLHFTQ